MRDAFVSTQSQVPGGFHSVQLGKTATTISRNARVNRKWGEAVEDCYNNLERCSFQQVKLGKTATTISRDARVPSL